MDSTLPTPTILENPDFAFSEDLLASIEDEDAYAAADLGPTDALSEEHRILEYELFYGPLSPDGTPSPSPAPSRSVSPAPSRSASPTPRSTPASTSTSEPPVRSGNSKTRRNKQKSSKNRAAARLKQCEECRGDPYSVRTSTYLNHVAPAEPTHTRFDLNSVPIASTGFVATADVDAGDICDANELVREHGCQYIPWDGM